MAISVSCSYCLSMIYTGFKRVESWWNYKNVISPFYRLYYIEKGNGKVYINNTVYELTPGTLFLIPKFTFHSYQCDDFMDHYYICFFDDLAGNIGIADRFGTKTSSPEQTLAVFRVNYILNKE